MKYFGTCPKCMADVQVKVTKPKSTPFSIDLPCPDCGQGMVVTRGKVLPAWKGV